MKQNQNGFAAMIAVLVVAAALVAGAGVYFYQTQVDQPKLAPVPAIQNTETLPNLPAESEKEIKTAGTASERSEPIDTSDWKTYRNEEYGFEFKYPKEWAGQNEVHYNDKNRNPSYQNLEADLLERIIIGDSFNIGIYGNNKKISLKDWLNNNRQQNEAGRDDEYGCGAWVDNSQDFSVGGSAGFIGKVPCCCARMMYGVFAAKDEKIFFMGFENDFDDKRKFLDIEQQKLLEKLLSTFKFIQNNNFNPGGFGIISKNYSGTYEYNNSYSDGDSSGKLYVKQISDKEIEFSLSLMIPRGNFGILSGARAILNGNKAIYEEEQDEYDGRSDKVCKFEIVFNDELAIINEIGERSTSFSPECGKGNFGAEVGAKGVYKKINNKILDL